MLQEKLRNGFYKHFLKAAVATQEISPKIDPKILDTLAKDYEIVVVTGTNGKTLTTALTVNILRQEFDEVLTNPTGANMEQGIVSTF